MMEHRLTAPRTDLTSRTDVESLVNTFYERVRADDLLGPIFEDVAQVNWDEHLPKMYAFWESVLFGTPGFKGNPLAVHRLLARRTPMTEREFSRWLSLFRQSVDDLFEGNIAEEAKLKAGRVAAIMQHHIAADRVEALEPTARTR